MHWDSELDLLSEPKSRASCSISLQQIDCFSVLITEQCPHVHLHRSIAWVTHVQSGITRWVIHSPAWSFMLTSLYRLFKYGAMIPLWIEHMRVMNRQKMGQVQTDTATLHPHMTVKKDHLHHSGLRISSQSWNTQICRLLPKKGLNYHF